MSAQMKRPGQCVAAMRRDSGATIVLEPCATYLESGQVLGVIEASGTWAPYAPEATDGRGIAAGVLCASAPPSDNQRRVLALVGDATVIRTELFGLDAAAERQLWEGPRVLPVVADPPAASIRVR